MKTILFNSRASVVSTLLIASLLTTVIYAAGCGSGESIEPSSLTSGGASGQSGTAGAAGSIGGSGNSGTNSGATAGTGGSQGGSSGSAGSAGSIGGSSGSAGTGGSAATGGSSGSSGSSGTGGSSSVRTMNYRNPFGNVAASNNLLWDGDFEFWSPFSDQYGWLNNPYVSFDFGRIIADERCRSGIKCARITNGSQALGIAVATTNKPLRLSFWANVEMGLCDGVEARVSDYWGSGAAEGVHAIQNEPDAQGWCRFDEVIAARNAKAFVVIKNNTGGFINLDDVVLAPEPDPSQLLVGPKPPLPPATLAEDDDIREALKKTRGPHDAPANDAKKALEQWHNRFGQRTEVK